MNARTAILVTDRCASALRCARGWQRAVYALGLGASGAFAFEPFRLFPLLLLSYAGLVVLLDGAAESSDRFRKAAFAGWSFGFGFFLFGLHWVGYAFLVDPSAHAWQLPFALVLLPGGLALFFSGAAMLCMLYWRPGASRIFVFALAFFVAEWLRGHILTGFPWNLPAYGWAASNAILQSASVVGAYGLSLLTLLFGASLAAPAKGLHDRAALLLPGAFALVFLALWGAGALRLADATEETVPGVHLRVVQPDTPQSEKYVQEYLVRNWRRLIDLSNSEGAVEPTHIIWPEAAPPFPLMLVPGARQEIGQMLDDTRILLTGDVRVENEQGQPRRVYNSFDIIGRNGETLSTYDKFHLVPFGEYLPFESILRSIGITEIAADTGFSSGPGPRTLTVPGAPPAGPLICYEVIFPQAVTGEPRPQWLVNITDDSWFGPNAGPMQHLLIARVRAIEEGLPIVRAANSGISAIIDAHGRVRKSLALGLRGVIDADLPVALSTTLFVRYGNVIIIAMVLLCASAAAWPFPRRRA